MNTATRLLTVAFAALAVAVPAQASIVDLTTAGSSGMIGDAFFQQIDDQSTGTGVIDPFVRIQANGTESGFNTDLRPLTGDLADVNSSAQYTKSILVSEFAVREAPNGVASLRFLLDINQTNANPQLSLDEMMVFVANRGDIGTMSDLMSEGTLLYDMDATEDSHVLMDYSLNPGSGGGDMFAFVKASLFAGHGDKYLYLYSRFGDTVRSNDGFEEWARLGGPSDPPPPPVIPEPATVLLLGGGILGAAAMRRRRRS
jgi:hypothetical protein